MPLYDYACTKCGKVREVRHGFDEGYDAPCEACGSPMRRVFNPAPILFKGSGFYVTDSRPSSGSEKSAAKPGDEKSATSEKPAGGEKPSNGEKPSTGEKPSSGEKPSTGAKPSDSAA